VNECLRYLLILPLFTLDTQGALSAATAQLGGQNVYGAAYLIQAAPGTLCPFYDGTTFTDAWGGTFVVRCGYQVCLLG
jgi:hypothetical protein